MASSKRRDRSGRETDQPRHCQGQTADKWTEDMRTERLHFIDENQLNLVHRPNLYDRQDDSGTLHGVRSC